jgi:putative FmdB family regulatory protein
MTSAFSILLQRKTREDCAVPRYEFLCRKCKRPFELLYALAEYEHAEKKLKCPKCRSARVVRQISTFEGKTSKKS